MNEQILIPDEDAFADQLHLLKEELEELGITLVSDEKGVIVVGGGGGYYRGRGVIQVTARNLYSASKLDAFSTAVSSICSKLEAPEIERPQDYKSSYHDEQKYLKRNFSAFKKRGRK